jgi:hypothetical protein
MVSLEAPGAANWIGRSSKEKCTLIEWSIQRLNRPSAAGIDSSD